MPLTPNEVIITLIVGTLLYAWADSHIRRKPRYDPYMESQDDERGSV